MTPAEEMARLGAQAKDAARAMTRATPEAKNQALLGLAQLHISANRKFWPPTPAILKLPGPPGRMRHGWTALR